VEAIGVERTYAKMKEASVIIYLIDLINDTPVELKRQVKYLKELNVPYLLVGNKMDGAQKELKLLMDAEASILISASQKENLENLKEALKTLVSLDSFKTGNTVVTNLRHYESLMETNKALDDVLTGIDNEVTNDFVAMDIRNSLYHLGLITGEITTDDLLENIFSKFCIGK
ncbi:MAG: tRNA uridine-5-carboxymethylaminomethyl(34) synthesis GTPase MnmE, partial [Cyclobacteriaceae bacterium]